MYLQRRAQRTTRRLRKGVLSRHPLKPDICMGEILPPKRVLPLLAVTSQYDAAFDWAEHQTTKRWGPVRLCSERFRFDQTDYYETSMGANLRKQFLVSESLFDPAELSHWKVETNQWEADFGDKHDYQESRPLNLDPGYLTEDKLVLASTKNHAHRIYVDNGIYAEITLQYRRREWQPCAWTYPDYRQPEFHHFFSVARDYLRQALRC